MADNKFIHENRGKEVSPLETVERIKKIIKDSGLGEPIYEEKVELDTCYSSHVYLGEIGTNGKGMTREFCMASGYAELMERLQNKALSKLYRHNKRMINTLLESYPTSTLADKQNKCINTIMEKLAKDSERTIRNKEMARAITQARLSEIGVNRRFVMRPFYSVSEQKEVMLPYAILRAFTGSNGMASGNTLEEAIVQGMSEVIERYATLQMIDKDLIPPIIPESEIEKYPEITAIIKKIESDPKYKVYIFDLSLGIELPCIAMMILNRETQTFGFKFGAYPEMKIALERCFSESMQGYNLETFTKTCSFSYSKMQRISNLNRLNIFKISTGVYSPKLLSDESSWEFKPWESVENLSNKEMMMKMIEKVKDIGSDIYIEDVSFLGFPAVYIYASGVSEVFTISLNTLNELVLKNAFQYQFSRLGSLTDKEVENLIMLANMKRGSVGEKLIGENVYAALDDKFPGHPFEMDFFQAMCYYRLGRNQEALGVIMRMQRTPYITSVAHYLTALIEGYSKEEIETFLRQSAMDDVAERVIDQLSDRNKVLEKIYTKCIGECEECSENCRQRDIQRMYEKLVSLEKERNLGAENLIELFK